MIQLLIFDLDGTLVNAYPAVIRSVNFTLTKLGFPKRTALEIRRAVGWGDRQLMAQFVGEGLADKAVKLYRPHHARALTKDVRFLPGAKALLQWAKDQGFKSAVATNRPARFTRIILKGLQAKEYFGIVLCADQLKKGKPDPQILNRICRELKISKQHALYVGDMTIDVHCGANAGIRTVAVATGSNTKKELNQAKPYRIINRIDQLKKLIY